MLISICIPAYKRVDYLKRLFDSIDEQRFRDFETIVTDDSADNSVQALCELYADKINIRYFRNQIVKGTPENWNEAMRHAKGEWIKLMHDDDWFASAHALQSFASAIEKKPMSDFFFCAYRNYFFENKTYREIRASETWLRRIAKKPASLLSRNVIGPPSVVLVKRALGVAYDRNLKWLVDIDYYIRVSQKAQVEFINEVLVDVGIGKEQVTQDCFRQRPIEIPENFYLLNKIGLDKLRNLIVYDAYWRLFRNLEIRKLEEIKESGFSGSIPVVIVRMISFQIRIPLWVLKTGILSKSLMFLSYLLSRQGR